MSTVRGHLNNFIRFSAVDGPGNRFVLFLQGCNFNCINCHNPYTIAECNNCGLCVEPCPEDALTLTAEPLVVVDRARCTECGICIDVCPYDSTPLSRWVSVDEIVEEIRVVAPFLSGITVSGGEATLQADFVGALFAAVKAAPDLRHLTTFVDTNGAAPQAVWEQLIPVMDGAMVDLKAFDPATHELLTAHGNEAVLESIRYLARHGRLQEVRLLMIPGYNDDRDVVSATADWLRTVDPDMRIELIGYRGHGVRIESEHLVEPEGALMRELAAAVTAVGLPEPVLV